MFFELGKYYKAVNGDRKVYTAGLLYSIKFGYGFALEEPDGSFHYGDPHQMIRNDYRQITKSDFFGGPGGLSTLIPGKHTVHGPDLDMVGNPLNYDIKGSPDQITGRLDDKEVDPRHVLPNDIMTPEQRQNLSEFLKQPRKFYRKTRQG